jgi:hypothetical protein
MSNRGMSRSLLLCVLLRLLSGCTRTENLASSGVADASARDAGVVSEAGPTACLSSPCAQCENDLDDDQDGLTDGFDPECTSPSDQFENSFASGVHGEDQNQKCKDCFFDDNSGSGDDGCGRALSCSLGGGSESGTGACSACAVEPRCRDSCEPLVPNGCDCFGCCGIWRDGVEQHVLLAASCTIDALAVPGKCTPCTPATDCNNPCGRCELCAGRRVEDLPTDCRLPGGPGYTCDESELCSSSADCSTAQYCQQGCCLAIGI